MAYNINGRRYDYRAALETIATLIISYAWQISADGARDIAENLLHNVTPGTRCEYAALRIACYYKD